MKSGNKFLMFSKAYALYRQKQVLYCMLIGLVLLLFIIGGILAKIYSFEMAYIPLPSFALAFGISLLFRKDLFHPKIITKLQEKYLLKQLDTPYTSGDDYEEITDALKEVDQMQIAL